MDDKRKGGSMLASTAAVLCAASFGLGVAVGAMWTEHRGGIPVPSQAAVRTPEAVSAAPARQEPPEVASARGHAAHSPDDPDAWAALGNACYDADMPEEAVRAYARSLELRPDVPDILTDMGSMQRMLGRPLDAVGSYDRALAASPGHANAAYNKGATLLLDLEDADAAMAFWNGLLARNPAFRLSDGRLLSDVVPGLLAEAAVRLEEHGRADAAARTAEVLAKSCPGRVPELRIAADVLERAGRKGGAESIRAGLESLHKNQQSNDGTAGK